VVVVEAEEEAMHQRSRVDDAVDEYYCSLPRQMNLEATVLSPKWLLKTMI
jgi:hypothetical protein